jgi:two-component system, NarL family, invasion response regulator UvrY
LHNVLWTAHKDLLKVPLMISVLVIDDHQIALQGCRRILEDAGVGPIFCATDLEAAYRLFLSRRPDVAIVDLALAADSLSGLGFIRRIKASPREIPIVVFSMHDDPAIVAQALEAGASSYVVKDADSEELIEAVYRVSTNPIFAFADDALRAALNESGAARGLAADAAWHTVTPYIDREQSLRPVLRFSEGTR